MDRQEESQSRSLYLTPTSIRMEGRIRNIKRILLEISHAPPPNDYAYQRLIWSSEPEHPPRENLGIKMKIKIGLGRISNHIHKRFFCAVTSVIVQGTKRHDICSFRFVFLQRLIGRPNMAKRGEHSRSLLQGTV